MQKGKQKPQSKSFDCGLYFLAHIWDLKFGNTNITFLPLNFYHIRDKVTDFVWVFDMTHMEDRSMSIVAGNFDGACPKNFIDKRYKQCDIIASIYVDIVNDCI